MKSFTKVKSKFRKTPEERRQYAVMKRNQRKARRREEHVEDGFDGLTREEIINGVRWGDKCWKCGRRMKTDGVEDWWCQCGWTEHCSGH